VTDPEVLDGGANRLHNDWGAKGGPSPQGWSLGNSSENCKFHAEKLTSKFVVYFCHNFLHFCLFWIHHCTV